MIQFLWFSTTSSTKKIRYNIAISRKLHCRYLFLKRGFYTPSTPYTREWFITQYSRIASSQRAFNTPLPLLQPPTGLTPLHTRVVYHSVVASRALREHLTLPYHFYSLLSLLISAVMCNTLTVLCRRDLPPYTREWFITQEHLTLPYHFYSLLSLLISAVMCNTLTVLCRRDLPPYTREWFITQYSRIASSQRAFNTPLPLLHPPVSVALLTI
ncbi:hypothetical protein J6590_049255 [Homalodisca vitripennis]|nr:hypothetical protein J6590_049255 [Homalodisca vitripennis]